MRGSTANAPRKYSLWEWGIGWFAWLNLLPIYLGLWFLAVTIKRLPNWMTQMLLRWHNATTGGRAQDVRIPGNLEIRPYMLRWWRVKRNAFFNIYFHQVFRSDEDRAHHTHPWWSFSIVLEGGYYEHRIHAGGLETKIWYGPGSILFRHKGALAHRLELARKKWPGFSPNELDGWTLGDMANVTLDGNGTFELPVKTIFVTGPVLQRWGFLDGLHGFIDAFDWDDHQAAKGAANAMPMGDYFKKGN
jgi:hypothetical protein